MIQKPWGGLSPTLFYLYLSHIHPQSHVGLPPAAYVSCLIRYVRKEDFVPNTGGVRHKAARGGCREWALNTLCWLASSHGPHFLSDAESWFLFLQPRALVFPQEYGIRLLLAAISNPRPLLSRTRLLPHLPSWGEDTSLLQMDWILRARALNNIYIYTNYILCERKALVQSTAAASEGTRWGHEQVEINDSQRYSRIQHYVASLFTEKCLKKITSV